MELLKDFIFKKGSELKVYTPERLVIMALEDYLSRNGYRAQVEEIEEVFKGMRDAKQPQNLNLDYLKPGQREIVFQLIQHRNLKEAEAIRWVLEHPKEVAALEGG